jgi:AraC-like DNA-binding protein
MGTEKNGTTPDAFRAVRPLDAPRRLFHVGGMPPPFREIEESVHPVGWRGETHHHAFWQLVFNRSGAAELRMARVWRVEPGQTVVIPPRLTHTWRNAGDVPLDLFNIHIFPHVPGHEDLIGYLRSVGASAVRPGLCPEQPRLARLAERAYAELIGGDRGYKWQAAAALMDLVMTALRGAWRREGGPDTATGAAAHVEKALWYLETHYAEPLRLADVAQMIHVSPKHACELITRATGTSPMQHLRRLRVEKAQALLEDTALSIKEVAYAVGISDEHYFSRLFHKVAGTPPSAYRRKCRG